jgi:Zn-dependent protease
MADTRLAWPTPGSGPQETVMNNSLRIGRVFGVPLRIHWSVPLLVFLFGYGLGSRTLPAWIPGQSDTTYTVAGLIGALLLLLSLLAHESAHAVTARIKGIPVQNVTLWALGGMTEMGKPPAPGAAFLVAVSGPLTSLVIGGAAFGAGIGVDTGLGWAVPAAVMVWLGWANLLLGVFNLLPAAPLDGGRVVQAAMWWRTGDRERAERAAGHSGQVLGILLIALGWISVLRGAFGGLWLALIGFFIVIVANAERQQASLITALRGLRAADAMSSPVETAPDWHTVQRFIDGPAMNTRHSTLPLLDFEGQPSGVLRLPELAKIPVTQRETLRLRNVATPLSQCTTCAPDDLLEDVLKQLRPGSGMRILVMDGHHLVGFITARDISRLAQRYQLRGTGSG